MFMLLLGLSLQNLKNSTQNMNGEALDSFINNGENINIYLIGKQTGLYIFLILLSFFGQGLVCYAISGLKLNIIEWQDVSLPGEIWKV